MFTEYERIPAVTQRRRWRVNGVVFGLGFLMIGTPASAQAGSCSAPDLEPAIFNASVPPDGTAALMLHFDDTNPGFEVTGYNVYGSFDPSLPQSGWELLAQDSGDEDLTVSGIQWSEPSAEPSAAASAKPRSGSRTRGGAALPAIARRTGTVRPTLSLSKTRRRPTTTWAMPMHSAAIWNCLLAFFVVRVVGLNPTVLNFRFPSRRNSEADR